MNPILVRKTSCSFLCKFSQQWWFPSFPMTWSIFFWRKHLRDHLGHLCRQTAPWWRVGRNSNPFSFTCRNDSLYEQRINDRIAERVGTSLLVAFRSTSFLDGFGSSFFPIRFLSFWLLKGCEQFVTGPELFFVVVNFIHNTRCFSGYHNVRCVRRISYWRNLNFIPISVKNFHNVNFQNWSNDGAFRNSCQRLSFG